MFNHHFKPNFRISIFASALTLFLMANAGIFYCFSRYKDQVQDDNAAVSVSKSSIKPDVVFAGSSTVLYPLYNLDAFTYGGGTLTGFENYVRVQFAEDVLTNKFGRDVLVNNVSFLGFMISDDLFVVKNYLRDRSAPKTLVLVVAPRDFYDSTFTSPATGIAFRKLSDWSKVAEFCGTYLAKPSDYADFIVGKSIFAFSIRGKIQGKLRDVIASKIPSKLLAPAEKVEDQDKWSKSTREYLIRYKNISFEKMDNQFIFLDRLFNTCKERGIDVVLVNAPLTERGLKLLPDGVYDAYNSKLEEVAKVQNCTYYDLSKSRSFSEDDFSDIVHLNEFGAKKLLSRILPTIGKSIAASSTQSAIH